MFVHSDSMHCLVAFCVITGLVAGNVTLQVGYFIFSTYNNIILTFVINKIITFNLPHYYFLRKRAKMIGI